MLIAQQDCHWIHTLYWSEGAVFSTLEANYCTDGAEALTNAIRRQCQLEIHGADSQSDQVCLREDNGQELLEWGVLFHPLRALRSTWHERAWRRIAQLTIRVSLDKGWCCHRRSGVASRCWPHSDRCRRVILFFSTDSATINGNDSDIRSNCSSRKWEQTITLYKEHQPDVANGSHAHKWKSLPSIAICAECKSAQLSFWPPMIVAEISIRDCRQSAKDTCWKTEPGRASKCIHTVHRSQKYIHLKCENKVILYLSNQNERELAVLRSMAPGNSNTEIAAAFEYQWKHIKSP